MLKAVKSMLADDYSLRTVVLDFEAALWKAMRKVFPQAGLRGCYFHFTQAVWRKIQLHGIFLFFILI